MRSFQHASTLSPVPGEIVSALGRIDRAAGAETRHRDQVPQLLDSLREEARIESVTASNAIEGIVVPTARAPGLLAGRTSHYRNRGEAEFAGYRAALDELRATDAGPLAVGLVLHLHRRLFEHTAGGGGALKSEDILVVDRSDDGSRRVRFTPISARETPYFLTELVVRTNDALGEDRHHPLIVIAGFALDLLCIHPFVDGNGRVARLCTTHLLDRAGYGVGRYMSVDQLIYDTRRAYYETLERSTVGWFDDGAHTIWPWARYLVGRLAEAYERFDARLAAGTGGGNKQDRVRDLILEHGPAEFTIADIRRSLPGISDNTIRLVLTDLRSKERIASQGTGRGATWRRI
jgi:Fic family protein